MFDVSNVLKFEIMLLINAVSCLLLGTRVSFNVWIISLKIGISIERGAWSEDKQELGRMEWRFSSDDPYQRNMRSMTELDSPAISEYLVGQGLVGEDRMRSKESAIIIKLLLIEE